MRSLVFSFFKLMKTVFCRKAGSASAPATPPAPDLTWRYPEKGAAMPTTPGVYRIGVANGTFNYAQFGLWDGSQWDKDDMAVGIGCGCELVCWRELDLDEATSVAVDNIRRCHPFFNPQKEAGDESIGT